MESPSEAGKCTVAQLKEKLCKRGLSTLGKKAELIGRLKDAEEEEEEEEVADKDAEELIKNISEIVGGDEIDESLDESLENGADAAEVTESNFNLTDQENDEENQVKVDVEFADNTPSDKETEPSLEAETDEVNEKQNTSTEGHTSDELDTELDTEKENETAKVDENEEEAMIQDDGIETQPDMGQMVLLDDLDEKDAEAMETEPEAPESETPEPAPAMAKNEENVETKSPVTTKEKPKVDPKSKTPISTEKKTPTKPTTSTSAKSTTPTSAQKKGPNIPVFKPKKEVPEEKIVKQDLKNARIQNTLAMYPLQMSDLSHPTMISCLEKCFNFNTRFDSPLANQQSKKWEGYLEICFTRHSIMDQCKEQLETMRQGLNVTALCDRKPGEILGQWHKQKGSTSDVVQDLLLYIEELPPKTKEEELRKILPKACEILIPKFPNGNIRGYGYATYPTTENLEEAVDSLAGKVVHGVNLRGATYNHAYAYHLINTVGWPPKGCDFITLQARIRVLEKLLATTPKPSAGILRKAQKLRELFDEQLSNRQIGPKKGRKKKGPGQPVFGSKVSPVRQLATKPGGNKPGNKPGGNKPGNKPGGNKPGGNKPAINKPGNNKPGNKQPLQRQSMNQLRKRQEVRRVRHQQLLDMRRPGQQRTGRNMKGPNDGNNTGQRDRPGPRGGFGPNSRGSGGPGASPRNFSGSDNRGPSGPPHGSASQGNRMRGPPRGQGARGPGPRSPRDGDRDGRDRGGRSGQEGLLPMLQQQGLLPKATSHEQLLAQQLITQQQQLMQLQQAQLEVQPLLKHMSSDLTVNQYRGRDVDHRQMSESERAYDQQDRGRNDDRKRKRVNSIGADPLDSKRSLLGEPPRGGYGSGSQERTSYNRDNHADYRRSDSSRYSSGAGTAAVASSSSGSNRTPSSKPYSPQYPTSYSTGYSGGYAPASSSTAADTGRSPLLRESTGGYGYGVSTSDRGRYSDNMQGSSAGQSMNKKNSGGGRGKKNRYSGGSGGGGGTSRNAGDGLDRENAQNLLLTLNQLLTTQLSDSGGSTGGYSGQRTRGNRR